MGGSQILILEQNKDSYLLKTDKDYLIFKLVEYGVEWTVSREERKRIKDWRRLQLSEKDGFTLHLDEEEKGDNSFMHLDLQTDMFGLINSLLLHSDYRKIKNYKN